MRPSARPTTPAPANDPAAAPAEAPAEFAERLASIAARAGMGQGQPVTEVEPEPAGQGGSVEAPTPTTRARKPRAAGAAVKEETGKHGLYLTDAVWERLQLEAIRKKTNVSAIANLLLERNLPRLRIERDA